jgi:hypothetical protein
MIVAADTLKAAFTSVFNGYLLMKLLVQTHDLDQVEWQSQYNG